MKRSAFLVVVVGLILCIALSGVSAAEKLVWYTFNPSWARDEAGAWVEQFAETHNVEIDRRIVGWGDVAEEVLLAVVSGIQVDVVTIDTGWDSLGLSGVLADLNTFIERDSDFPRDELFHLNMQARQGPKGEQWMFPANVDVDLLFFNKSLFELRGLTLPDRDTTWDEWLALGQKATFDESGDGLNDYYGISHWNQPWVWQYMVCAMGARPFKADGAPDFGQPEAREAYEYWRSWYEPRTILGDLSHVGYSNGPDAWAGGRLAMYINTPYWAGWTNRHNVHFEWDIALMPAAPTGQRPSFLRGSGMAVVAQSEQKDLAYEFAKQVLLYDPAATIARHTGMLMTNREASLDYSLDPAAFPSVDRIALLEAPASGLAPPAFFWDSIRHPWMSAMNPYFNGDIALEEAIVNAEVAVTAKLQDMGVLGDD